MSSSCSSLRLVLLAPEAATKMAMPCITCMHAHLGTVAGQEIVHSISTCQVRLAGEWLDGMTAKVPRNDAPDEIEVHFQHTDHRCSSMPCLSS